MSSRTQSSPAPPAEPDMTGGRPIGHDEIDPELVKLIKPRIRLGLVTSGAIVMLSIFLMVKLRHDLAFSRATETPGDVTLADIAAGNLGEGSHVRIHAVPDRTLVGLVARSGADYGNRIAPALGSAGTLWIVIDGSVWNAERSYAEVYSGRLRRLSDLPFADNLRAFVASNNPSLRYVTGAALKDALTAGATTTLTAAGGDPVEVGPTTIVEISREAADAVLVHAAETDRQPDEAAWRAALTAAGLTPASSRPEKQDDRGQEGWVFRIEAAGARAAAEQALADGALHGARAEPEMLTVRAAWQDLRAEPDALEMPTAAGPVRLPWSSLDLAGVEATRTIPAGAMVLLTRENPGNYWYLLPIYVLLAAFTLLFSWAFVRRLRDQTATPAPIVARPAP